MSELYRIAFLLFFVLIIGYLIGHIKSVSLARIMGWSFIVVAIISADVLFNDVTPFIRMLAIITTTLLV